MTLKLQQIDELLRPQHFFLTAEDDCYFLREYTAGAGFGHGETNNIISNLKKSVDRRGSPEWKYKEAAIRQAGTELRAALGEPLLRQVTIVPMPPSRSKSNLLYDDRMVRIVEVMTDGLTSDVRELIVQPNDMPAAHATATRPRPEDWYGAYAVDESFSNPPPTNVLVIDDVLTARRALRGIEAAAGGAVPRCRGVWRVLCAPRSATRLCSIAAHAKKDRVPGAQLASR